MNSGLPSVPECRFARKASGLVDARGGHRTASGTIPRTGDTRTSVRPCSYGRVVRVGIVGHRSLSAEGAAFAERVCAEVLADLCSTGARLTALSALAEGADTLFADVALASGVPLEVVQPHDQYLDDFRTTTAQNRYVVMCGLARRRTALPYRNRRDAAYEAGMRWVADRSNLLVAIWDGRPSATIGGTAHTVTYAQSSGCPVVHVNIEAERVCLV
jgi:hypothetical protein